MLNNAQMTETQKRTRIAINSKMGWLSFDKKDELVQIVGLQKAVMEYKPEQTIVYFTRKLAEAKANLTKCDNNSPCFEKLVNLIEVYQDQLTNPEPIPCIEYLKIIAVRQAFKPGNYIAVKGQRIAEQEAQQLEEALEEINLDGETSRFNPNYTDVSFNQLQEESGYEPVCHRLNPEQAMIQAEEDAVRDADEAIKLQMLAVTRKNPFCGNWLNAVIEHFENGGTMKSFAAKFGMSGQTAINRIKRMVSDANNDDNPMLPFETVAAPVIPVIPTRKQTKKATTNTHDQLTLF
jgi:hypothetical protein